MLQSKKEIQEWLTSHNIENFTINDDLTVDVDGDVKLHNKQLTDIPVKFGKVHKFYCHNNQLTSLEFSPQTVNIFFCGNNQLTSLEFSPQTVNEFYCHDNQLTSLEFAPQTVKDFYCPGNQLTSLEGLNIFSLKDLICDDNLKETDLYKKWKLYRTLS